MGVYRYGETGLLVDAADATAARAVATAALRELDGVVDAVPSAMSVLLRFADAGRLPEATRWLDAALRTGAGERESGRGRDAGQGARRPAVEIPVHYDGADLDAVADACGIGREEVVRRHTAPTYLAQFAGFAPGFVYLDGLDPVLRLPRRAEPRTRVPTGAVALAFDYTAVYPRTSPGGWHLLGRTDLVMFDADRERPALLEPGDRVRFVVVRVGP